MLRNGQSLLVFVILILSASVSFSQLISQSVTTIHEYATSQKPSSSIGGSLLTFAEIIRQKSNGNQVQQCPCVRAPGTNRCITYDSRFQGASIEEAILTFVDTSMDSRIFEERNGGPISSRSLSCTSQECRQCAAILAFRLRQIGLIQRSPTFSFPIPDFGQIQPQLCRRLRLSRTVPSFPPPARAPAFVTEMVSAGLARIPARDTTPRTAFGAAVAAAIRQARSVRGRPFFDVIARIRNQRLQNSGDRRNQQNNNQGNGNNNNNAVGGGGGGTRGISRPQQPNQGQFPPQTFPPQRPQQNTPNNFPNRVFPQPQQRPQPQQPIFQQPLPAIPRPQRPPQFPQQPQQPIFQQPPSIPRPQRPPQQQPIFQQPQFPGGRPPQQQPQQPIFQQPIFQQPQFPGGQPQQPQPGVQQPQFPGGQQQPPFQQPGIQQPIFQQPLFPQTPEFPNGPQSPSGLFSPQNLGNALSIGQQLGSSIPNLATGGGNPFGGGGGPGGGGGHAGGGIGVGGGGGGPPHLGGSGEIGPFFGKRKKRAADDGILGDRFVISCVERGDVETESSDYLNLCTACWTWRQLPPDYFPRLINELVCNENDYCLSGWGTCMQRYRNVDVLRRGPNGQWQPTSISVATCCDCKVKAGTEVHALVIGKNKV